MNPEPTWSKYIMTAAEYAQLSHRTPYVFQLSMDSASLFFFGFSHSNDPAHPAYALLRQEFARFWPTLTLIEGNPAVNDLSLAELKTRAAAFDQIGVIKQMGESAFTLMLAVAQDCPVQSPEPSFGQVAEYIQSRGYSLEDIFAQYVLTDILQYLRLPERPPLQVYLEPRLYRLKQQPAWAGFACTYEMFTAVYERLLGRPFSLANEKFLIDAIDPTPWPDLPHYGVLNHISALHSRCRDEFMVDRIQALLSQGNKRIFIVFGASHAVMQEPALRRMFGQNVGTEFRSKNYEL